MAHVAEQFVPVREYERRPVILSAGQPLERAEAAMVLVHGRGGSAKGILALSEELSHPGFAYLAPQAAVNSWYPFSFLAPIADNEPQLSASLATLRTVLDRLNGVGLPPQRTILLGFSQGACLTLEYAARFAQRYGGVAALSGGLIGPDGTPRGYPGSMAGTAVFLGCSDGDPHIPKARVLESAQVMERLGAEVTTRLYPNLGHTINRDELKFVRIMMDSLWENPTSESAW